MSILALTASFGAMEIDRPENGKSVLPTVIKLHAAKTRDRSHPGF